MAASTGHRLPSMTAGRHMAARALLGWLDDEHAPRLCVVTGSPGSGKSHLMAWLHAASEVESTPPERRIHVFLPVRELTVHSVVLVLADRLGVAARTPRELVAGLAAEPRRIVIGVADIAAFGGRPDEGRRIVAELLDPLLELPHVRLVVECADAELRAVFTRVVEPAVLDLDEVRWTDPGRFERWYADLVAASPFTSPFGADAVYPHPGLARLAARVDGSRVAGLPADAASWPAPDKASHVRHAWWTCVSEAAQPVIATLGGLGTPLTYEQWETAYRALDGAEDPRAASAVARAALYLPPVGDDPRTWHLAPGPLAAFVAARFPQAADAGRSIRAHTALRRAVDGGPASAADKGGKVGKVGNGGTDGTDGAGGAGGTDEERITAILDHSVHIGDAATFVADPVVQAAARPHSVISALVAGGQWEDLPRTAFRGASPALIAEPDPAVRAALLRAHLLGRDDDAA
ncbi:hypothetical protein GT354_16405, partial [Streptomyces sp. SID3343]|nr:hypothetical protein [Streptomyces sp. SID3343]